MRALEIDDVARACLMNSVCTLYALEFRSSNGRERPVRRSN